MIICWKLFKSNLAKLLGGVIVGRENLGGRTNVDDQKHDFCKKVVIVQMRPMSSFIVMDLSERSLCLRLERVCLLWRSKETSSGTKICIRASALEIRRAHV